MQITLITRMSTVGHSDLDLTDMFKDFGYAVFKADNFGQVKYILSHPSPTWVPDFEELTSMLNSKPNYVYMAEAFELAE